LKEEVATAAIAATATATATTTTTTTTTVLVAVATTVATTMYHPRFLSRTEFDQMSTAATLATTAATVAEPTTAITAAPIFDRPQIVQWRTLEVGAVFRVLDRVTIPTVPEPKHYAVLQTEQQQIIHVWITDIINRELLKYNLPMGNVFIKPLGKKKSNTSEFEYFNFDIAMDVVNSFNFIHY
jgi:hypothetical protein